MGVASGRSRGEVGRPRPRILVLALPLPSWSTCASHFTLLSCSSCICKMGITRSPAWEVVRNGMELALSDLQRAVPAAGPAWMEGCTTEGGGRRDRWGRSPRPGPALRDTSPSRHLPPPRTRRPGAPGLVLALARCRAVCQGWQGSAQAGGACRKRCAAPGPLGASGRLWRRSAPGPGQRL